MDEFNLENDTIETIVNFEMDQLSLCKELISSYNSNIVSLGYKEEIGLEYNESVKKRPPMEIGYECVLNYTVKKNECVFFTRWPIVRIDENKKVMLFRISSDEISSDITDMVEEIECTEKSKETGLPLHTKNAWSSKPYKSYNAKEKSVFWILSVTAILFPVVLILACMLSSIAVYLVIGELILLCTAIIIAKKAGII